MPVCDRCRFAYLEGESHNCGARRPPTETERATLKRNFLLLCLLVAFMALATGVRGAGSSGDRVFNVVLNFVLNPFLLLGGGYILFRLNKGYPES
jgi:hypothetical protein